MAYIQPDGEIKFLRGVPLDPDYENTLYFATANDQYNYFSNKVFATFNNTSYTRKERGWLKVGWSGVASDGPIMHRMYNASYMMFKNTAFENKWFYAFVDRVNYINNNTVEVQFHIDVMQTWHFDYVFNQCMIERQHTETDYVGDNTLPEGLELGPYMSDIANYVRGSDVNNSGQFEYEPGVCIVTSFDPASLYSQSSFPTQAGRILYGTQVHGNLFSGAYYTLWPLNSSTIPVINDLLNTINAQAKIDGVVAIYMFPYDFRNAILDSGASAIITLNFYQPETLGSYTPRNNKLLTYPYRMLYVSNNQGNCAEYCMELFQSGIASFRIFGNCGPDGGMLFWPFDYKGVPGSNFDEAIAVSGFPMCSWAYDSFKAWLAQNAGTIAAGAATLSGKWATIAFAPTGTAAALASGAMDANGYVGQHTGFNYNQPTPSTGLIGATLGAIGQLYDHSRVPPQVKGNTNLSLSYQASLLTFNFYHKHIKEEYAKIIDKYFDMYGYKINKVGTPNRAARACYTYVKTIGCSLEGELPADDKATIQGIFDKGIRFWRSSATFGNYDPAINNNRA